MNAKTCSSTLNNDPHENSFASFLRNKVHKSIFLSPTSPDELEEIVKNFENDKASDISIAILKKCFGFLSTHLSGFLNEFMKTGIFPDILKLGKITPICI